MSKYIKMEQEVKFTSSKDSLKVITSIQYVRVCDMCGKSYQIVELINMRMFQIQAHVLDICDVCKKAAP